LPLMTERCSNPIFRSGLQFCDEERGTTMHITSSEAVTMFARYCHARFGKKAPQKIRDKAKALKRRGDDQGHDVWNKVADEIEKSASMRSR
jgi:hypothetical protein